MHVAPLVRLCILLLFSKNSVLGIETAAREDHLFQQNLSFGVYVLFCFPREKSKYSVYGAVACVGRVMLQSLITLKQFFLDKREMKCMSPQSGSKRLGSESAIVSVSKKEIAKLREMMTAEISELTLAAQSLRRLDGRSRMSPED